MWSFSFTEVIKEIPNINVFSLTVYKHLLFFFKIHVIVVNQQLKICRKKFLEKKLEKKFLSFF